MTDLPDVQPLPTITADHLRAALGGIEPGWYRSSDLLPRYNAWAESEGKTTITAKTLGEAIARELKPQRRSSGHVAHWLLDARGFRGEGRVDIWDSPLKDVDISALPRYPGT